MNKHLIKKSGDKRKMDNELSKGFTGIEINGVKFSNIKEMLIYMNKQRDRIIDLEKENAELKELIKNIIRVTWGEGWNYSLDWKVKAEQFLSGVEK